MFGRFEGSRASAKPYYLYFIRYGSGANDFYAFTNNEFPVTTGGVTYDVRQMTHGDISTTGSLDKTTVELMSPKNNELFELFRVYPPSYRVQLTIMKGHYGDPENEVKTIWSGRILNMSVRGSECTYSCEPILTALKRLGLRRNWQYGCPHPLYLKGCFADKNAVKRTATVAAISGAELTLSANWNGDIAFEKFIGGFIEIETPALIPRSILRVAANVLTIAGSMSNLTVGANLKVYPGCAHNMDDCKSVHNNIVNFGGQPWIPTDNPVGNKNNFY